MGSVSSAQSKGLGTKQRACVNLWFAGAMERETRGSYPRFPTAMGSVSPFRDPEEKNECGEGQTDESKY